MHFFHPLTGRFDRNKKFGGRKSHFFFLSEAISLSKFTETSTQPQVQNYPATLQTVLAIILYIQSL